MGLRDDGERNRVRAPADRRRHRRRARTLLAPPRPIEIYRGRPILYGCGDVIDDYEGIGGHESFRGDLRLLYLVSTDAASRELVSLRMIPMRVRRMRLERTSQTDARTPTTPSAAMRC